MPYIGAGIQKFNTADGLTVSGNAEVTTADNTVQLTLKSTDADATSGPVLSLLRDSGSPADSDVVGEIRFNADNDAGEETEMANIFAQIGDASDGTEDAQLITRTMLGGTMRARVSHLVSETVFNEDSVDVDFRVESNGNANMFVVDAGTDKIGIGTAAPNATVEMAAAVNPALSGVTNRNPIIQLSNTDTGYVAGNATAIDFATSLNYTNASIICRNDNAGNGYGGSLIFATSPTSGDSLAERMRINNDGRVNIGGTAAVVISSSEELTVEGAVGIKNTNNVGLGINRDGGDGILIALQESGTQEGTISVSGTTVTFNGGHLGRFSQATDGNRIDGLVKGTVMTNLDQMAKWHHEAKAATYYIEDEELPVGKKVGDEKTPAVDAYDEDNEQLNCMAVSSVEGDVNVAGVFVNWDDDDKDYTADMNIAMTGDMVIRIAQGTTVSRGDLLMSAGDGTAKPQGDGYVQDKTIAKVTSTTKSHTYDDGSYLVPCVLMAC